MSYRAAVPPTKDSVVWAPVSSAHGVARNVAAVPWAYLHVCVAAVQERHSKVDCRAALRRCAGTSDQ